MDTTEKILNTLRQSGKPLKSGEISSLGQMEKKEVDKTLKSLQKAGIIISPSRCYYQINNTKAHGQR